MGLICVENRSTGEEVLYDRDTMAVHNPNPQSINMRFTTDQLCAARLVVGRTRDHKIEGIKIIRGLSNLGLLEAKTLWELAEKNYNG